MTKPSITEETREIELSNESTPRPWWLHTTGSHIGIKANGRFVVRKVVSHLSLQEYQRLHADFVLTINAVNSLASLTAERDRLRDAATDAERELSFLVHGTGAKGGLYEAALKKLRTALEGERLTTQT
jgi:hypothetical protein